MRHYFDKNEADVGKSSMENVPMPREMCDATYAMPREMRECVWSVYACLWVCGFVCVVCVCFVRIYNGIYIEILLTEHFCA